MINSPLFLNMFLDAHFENIFFLRKSGKCSQSSHKMVDFGGEGRDFVEIPMVVRKILHKWQNVQKMCHKFGCDFSSLRLFEQIRMF